MKAINPHMPRRLPLTALALCLACAHAAWADGAPADADPGYGWGVGGVVFPRVRAYKDFRHKTEVFPMVTYENAWVRVFGPGLEFKLGQAGPVAFGLTLAYGADEGYQAKDSPTLAGMADRKASFWVGTRVAWRTELAQLSAELAGDASGNSKGQKLKVGVERRFDLGAFGIAPRAQLSWQDQKYVQYYYGVEQSEARSGRAAYQAKGTLNTELAVRLDYRLAPNQTTFVDLGVTRLGSSIKDSPLVDRSTLPMVRVGFLYRF